MVSKMLPSSVYEWIQMTVGVMRFNPIILFMVRFTRAKLALSAIDSRIILVTRLFA